MRFKLVFYLMLLSVLVVVGCVNSDVKPENQKSSSVTILQKGEHKDDCFICGMKLANYYKTNHVASTEDGTIRQYCSIHCLAEDKSIKKSNLKDIKVVAIDIMKFIPTEDATYVVGSEVRGTMSPISKFAFKGRMSARRFANKHQGLIMDFDKAYEYALKDFKK